MNRFEYVHAATAAEAAGLVPADGRDVTLKGAGIDLLALIKDRVMAPKRVVSLLRAAELRKLAAGREGLTIGALVTLAQLGAHDEVRKSFKALAEAASHAATPQIRNVATVGGNLCQRPRCWYFRSADFQCLKKGGAQCFAVDGENQFHAIFGASPCKIVHPSNLASPLVALEAKVRVVGPSGERTLTMEEFFDVPGGDVSVENVLKPNEVVVSVEVPSAGWSTGYGEVREKQSFDWPLVTVAAAVKVEGGKFKAVRLVFGAVGNKPWRIPAVEKMLEGAAAADADAAAKAAARACEEARPLAQNAYKVAILRALIPRALAAASGAKPDGGREY